MYFCLWKAPKIDQTEADPMICMSETETETRNHFATSSFNMNNMILCVVLLYIANILKSIRNFPRKSQICQIERHWISVTLCLSWYSNLISLQVFKIFSAERKKKSCLPLTVSPSTTQLSRFKHIRGLQFSIMPRLPQWHTM